MKSDSAPDDAAIISVLEAISENESIDGYTIRYWANHAKCRIESQAKQIAELKAELAEELNTCSVCGAQPRCNDH